MTADAINQPKALEPTPLAANGYSSSNLTRALRRPELGALTGTVLVFALFGIFAGNSGLFSPLGISNFL
ncbi:MAG: hypothetical protein ACT6U0_09385, partial [Shinella sp.]